MIREAPTDSDHIAYCRNARRLRSRLRGRPELLHRSLRQLAASQRPPRDTPQALGPARQFCMEVVMALDGSVLRYSLRESLLRRARTLGLERFEASLLISMVQQQMAVGATPASPGSDGPAEGDAGAAPTFWPAVACVLVAQSVVVLGAWWLLM